MTLGDFDTSAVVYGKFSTFRPSTGATYTLGGTPALSVYKDNSTTQSTAGVTLTVDFDGVTGLNHFAIDTSSDGTFYSAGSFFDVVISTGTVDGVSVTGAVVARFTIRKNSALKPTTAGRTLDVSAGGEAGLDWANIGSPTTDVGLSGTTIATVTNLTNLPSIPANWLTAAGIAADVTTELQSGLATAASIAALNNLSAADVWGYATRLLTGGDNIVLAKGTGITGFNDLSAAQVNAEVDTALADVGLTTTVTGRIDAAVSTRLASASYTAPDNASIMAILEDTGTTLPGTLATIGGYIDTEIGTIITNIAAVKSDTAAILLDTGTDGVVVATGSKTGYALTSAYDFAKGNAAMTEAYPTAGATMTPIEAIYSMHQLMAEQSIVSTTLTAKKRDQSTVAKTYTLNSATTPTSITEV